MRRRDPEPGNATDGVDERTEPVGLVTDREFQWSVDVTLLFITAKLDAVLIWPVVD